LVLSGPGIGGVLTHWELYGMITTGVLGMLLLQSALNAGQLISAQPGLTLTDPIVSILWGVLVFGERVRTGWFVILAVAGAHSGRRRAGPDPLPAAVRRLRPGRSGRAVRPAEDGPQRGTLITGAAAPAPAFAAGG
jgi:hypothetical protein